MAYNETVDPVRLLNPLEWKVSQGRIDSVPSRPTGTLGILQWGHQRLRGFPKTAVPPGRSSRHEDLPLTTDLTSLSFSC